MSHNAAFWEAMEIALESTFPEQHKEQKWTTLIAGMSKISAVMPVKIHDFKKISHLLLNLQVAGQLLAYQVAVGCYDHVNCVRHRWKGYEVPHLLPSPQSARVVLQIWTSEIRWRSR